MKKIINYRQLNYAVIKIGWSRNTRFELYREHGMSTASFYKWRVEFDDMDASLMVRLKELLEWMANNYIFCTLCLISHSKNSRLSNLQPQQKREHFEASIVRKEIDSLKLLAMIELMKRNSRWSKSEIICHSTEIVELLAEEVKEMW